MVGTCAKIGRNGRLVSGPAAETFRDKVRGAHPEDDLGHQMQLMVSVLGDDQAINDVAVYISGLGYSDPSYVAASKTK